MNLVALILETVLFYAVVVFGVVLMVGALALLAYALGGGVLP
jgi:hypothetical protein